MVYEAGMISFLRTILVIALIYYGVKLVIKFLLPFILKKFVQKQQEKFTGQQNKTSRNTTTSQEPKVTNKPKEKLGDYVEYEEVD